MIGLWPVALAARPRDRSSRPGSARCCTGRTGTARLRSISPCADRRTRSIHSSTPIRRRSSTSCAHAGQGVVMKPCKKPPVIGVAGMEEIRQDNPGDTPDHRVHRARPQGRNRQACAPRLPDRRRGNRQRAPSSAPARQVAVVSAKRWALINELDGAGTHIGRGGLLARSLRPHHRGGLQGRNNSQDRGGRRSGAVSQVPLAGDHPNVLAIAADYSIHDGRLPVFALDDVTGIADFIAEAVGVTVPRPAPSTMPRR